MGANSRAMAAKKLTNPPTVISPVAERCAARNRIAASAAALGGAIHEWRVRDGGLVAIDLVDRAAHLLGRGANLRGRGAHLRGRDADLRGLVLTAASDGSASLYTLDGMKIGGFGGAGSVRGWSIDDLPPELVESVAARFPWADHLPTSHSYGLAA